MNAIATFPDTAIRHRTHRTVPLQDITIDPRVQRVEGVDERRVDKMAANFNPDALGVFILSERPDGSLICLDAMHRRATCLRVGYTGYVDAIVFTGLSLAEEAALFLLYNDKKDPSAISRFKARVLTGEPAAMQINHIIKSHGWAVHGNKNQQRCLAAIDKVEAIYRSAAGTRSTGSHPDVLDRTLAIVTAAWGHDPNATHGMVLSGVAQLIGRFGDAVDSEKLVKEMQQFTPTTLYGRAKALTEVQGGTVAAALAKILTGLHNKKRRNNLLPEWIWVR